VKKDLSKSNIILQKEFQRNQTITEDDGFGLPQDSLIDIDVPK
jgi:hypothetical protein